MNDQPTNPTDPKDIPLEETPEQDPTNSQTSEPETVVPSQEDLTEIQTPESETVVPSQEDTTEVQTPESETVVPSQEDTTEVQTPESETVVPSQEDTTEVQTPESETVTPSQEDTTEVQAPESDIVVPSPVETSSSSESQTPIDPDDIIYEMSDLDDDDSYGSLKQAVLESRYEMTMREFRSRQLVDGKIVTISSTEATVDIGFKSEGVISLEEFTDPSILKVGDIVEVCIENIENREGTLVLSKKKAEFTRTWEKITTLYHSGEMVEAQIVRRIKGGMVVDLYGVDAFLPGSQIDIHPVRDFDALVSVMMDFRVIKINNTRKNVVLSHKVLIEESLREIREKLLSELEVGQIVEGIVKNITDFGVFVDLGGVDGLLHITDLSWGRVSHPSEVVGLDEMITVKVLQYDKERQRISLGLKQLNEPNWDNIEKKYPSDHRTIGRVVAIVKYGAFVELEPGVEGLVHISEMSWTQHVKHPSQMVSVDQEVEIVILNFDRENRKISLGMKQIEPDPWERLENIYIPGTRHKGLVRDLVPFGAFVELEPGIDGLIHISDLSWTRKVRHPGEIVKKGEEIDVVILNFDRNERRIALGYKQLIDDPWDDFEKEYRIRVRTEASVIRVLDRGVVVMLPLGVEGFIPNSQLGRSLSGDKKRNIHEGDNLELEVIEFDKSNHRIVLSHSIIERTKEKESNYRTREHEAKTGGTTIGDIMRESGQFDVPTDAESDKPAERKSKPKARKATPPRTKADDKGSESTPSDKTSEVIQPSEPTPPPPEAVQPPGETVVETTEAKVDVIEDAPQEQPVPEVEQPPEETVVEAKVDLVEDAPQEQSIPEVEQPPEETVVETTEAKVDVVEDAPQEQPIPEVEQPPEETVVETT
ncbi:MAG: 30S ribosomal protein S1, partial [Candidatus Electryoneaceae bacterium]|nr:30S ribosomal protein S1 [Candidatus Electryoneaceae bacterium]